MYKLVTHVWFDYVMFAIILANCVFMALENPNTDEKSTMGQMEFWSNLAFTVIFTVGPRSPCLCPQPPLLCAALSTAAACVVLAPHNSWNRAKVLVLRVFRQKIIQLSDSC